MNLDAGERSGNLIPSDASLLGPSPEPVGHERAGEHGSDDGSDDGSDGTNGRS